MDFQLIPASSEYKEVINNLMQFYIYDFSEYVDRDVEEDGLFAVYPHLEGYWIERNKYPYIVTSDGRYMGFVLVRFIESSARHYYSMAEFFIMKKYRRRGIGKAVATQVFDLHRGQWEVYQRETNKPAQLFWLGVIDEYTNGAFKDRLEDGRRVFDFGN
jgi:predicted acetyltransferase